jgi:hypothetical protein
MSVRGWRSKLPRVFIAGIATVAAIAIISEMVSERDVGGELIVDVPTPTIESRSWAVGQEPTGVIFDGERLWVAETGFGSVTSYGLEGQRLDTADVGGQPAVLASGAGFVWALDADDGSVTQLDADANVVRKFQVGLEPAGLIFLGDHLWVSDPIRGSVSKISLQGALAQLLEIGVSPGAITKTPEQVLVVDGDTLTVTGIDPGGNIVGSFEYPDQIDIGDFEHVPGTPTAFLSIPDALWIAFGGIGQVMRLTPAGTFSGLTRVPTGPLALAWSGSELWVVSTDAATITRISSTGTIIATHDIGGSPTGIAHDGEHGWVTDSEKNVLIRFTPVELVP